MIDTDLLRLFALTNCSESIADKVEYLRRYINNTGFDTEEEYTEELENEIRKFFG